MCGELWSEFFRTAIDILNFSASTMGEKTRCESWDGKLPHYCDKLEIIGQIGIVHDSGMHTKVNDKGFAAMLVR